MKKKGENKMQIRKSMVLSIIILMITATIIPAAMAATLTSDKLTYYIGEDQTATLYGSDFTPGELVTIQVTIEENSTYFYSDTVTADELGSFTYVYNLSGIVGTYTATALDEAGNVLATTTFQDPAGGHNVDFDQTGVGTDFTGTVVTFDSVDYGVSDLPTGDVSDAGGGTNGPAFQFYSPLVVDSSKQYVWISTTGTAGVTAQSGNIKNLDGTIIGNYETQWNLTVQTSGLDGQTTNVYNGSTILGTATDDTPFSMWVNDGDHLSLDIDPNVQQYAFTHWSGDITGTTRPYIFNSINSALDITANYETLPPSALSVITSRGGMQLDSFRLIFTNDPAEPTPGFYKVTATNPGQFAYNVFYTGDPDSDVETLTITLPTPYFVPQGANPVQIYDGVSVTDDHYNPAGNGITNQFDITIDYGVDTITIAPNEGTVFPATGLIYILVHVDYGLKGQGGYTKGGSGNDAISSTTDPDIPDLKIYTFSVSDNGVLDSQTISSTNVFKNDPGVAGIVLDSTGNPVSGASVQIKLDGKTVTVTTDEDGFFMYYYKYTGKATTATVTLLGYNQVQKPTVKSNRFVFLQFIVP
jgi:hypothetical protein